MILNHHPSEFFAVGTMAPVNQSDETGRAGLDDIGLRDMISSPMMADQSRDSHGAGSDGLSRWESHNSNRTQFPSVSMQPKHVTEKAVGRMTAGVTGLNLHGRAVLVASDGSPTAQAAARIAGELERERGAVPEILQVFDLRSYPVVPFLVEALGAADQLLGETAHDDQRLEVIAQLAGAAPTASHWPVHIGAGTPAVQIVTLAEKLNAALTLIGLRQHGRLDRITGDETTLHVQRRSSCPVLAVRAGTTGLARRIVAGIDFSRASVAAARAALDVAASDAEVTLVHAHAPNGGRVADDEYAVVEELGIARALEEVRAFLMSELPTASTVKIDTLAESARPSELLLSTAARLNAELIAIASHRHGRVARLVLGSVADELTHACLTSLLLVPPAS